MVQTTKRRQKDEVPGSCGDETKDGKSPETLTTPFVEEFPASDRQTDISLSDFKGQ